MNDSPTQQGRSPTSVIGERLGQLGGIFFSCLSSSDVYQPSPDENDLIFDIPTPPVTKPIATAKSSSVPERESTEQTMREPPEGVVPRSNNTTPSNYMTCDGCGKRIYPTDATTRAFSPTRIFHMTCFKCYLCQGTLKHHGGEICFAIPNDDYSTSLILLCLPCQQESLSKYSDKTEASIAGKRVEPAENELGDVDGVIDEIGDDLERVMMEHYVPTCTICGGNFLSYNSNKVVLLGPNLKYHYECWETGKPSIKVQQRKLEPLQALKYLPSEIIVRIKSDVSVSTWYFIWKDRLEDLKEMIDHRNGGDNCNLTVRYSIDQSAVVSGKSSIPWAPQSSLYTFELVGEPLGMSALADSTTTITTNVSGASQASGRMHVTRFELNHLIQIDIPIRNEHNVENLNPRESTLTITLADD